MNVRRRSRSRTSISRTSAPWKEPDHDDPPRIPARFRRGPRRPLRAAAGRRRPPPARLLDARLSGVDLDRDPGFRTIARLRRRRAAGPPENDGLEPGPRVLARGRTSRLGEAAAPRPRAAGIRP